MKNQEIENTKGQGQVLRFSFRLSGRSTSITLKKNILSLWLILSDTDYCKDPGTQDAQGTQYTSEQYYISIQKYIDSCIDKWTGDTARGLSDFITDMMLQDILEEEDFRAYKVVFNNLH
jgi:hypothetical protein